MRIFGRLCGERLLLARRQRYPKRFGDLMRDLVLHDKDVLHLAIVSLRPERKFVCRVYQLGVDAKSVSDATQAAGKDMRSPEFPSDLSRGHRSISIWEDICAEKCPQPAYLRKLSGD